MTSTIPAPPGSRVARAAGVAGAQAPLTPEACWQAVKYRDRRASGRFCYAVVTTGIYCRPDCGARLALRENVRFFATPDDAKAAGFRPCKRCRPDEEAPDARLHAVMAACRAIEAAETPPRLHELAAGCGLSAHHFHRLFKKFTGVTPKAYADACRTGRLRKELLAAPSVTGAIYAAGYSSSSRFYEAADAVLGMTPASYRKGGEDMEIGYAAGESALGTVLVAGTARGVCAIFLGGGEAELADALKQRFPRAVIHASAALADKLDAVVRHIERPADSLDLPLDIQGTAFQRRVWEALMEIPCGKTASYAEIARRLGQPQASRAVAQACASNTLALAVPCHRVVRSGGALSGYRWGVERKRQLLERERAARRGDD
jgi:AraC family transcriptional regulator, regulatory protein of adaptative response / methylated-DNA-[protein]-cysteine methyltransferase